MTQTHTKSCPLQCVMKAVVAMVSVMVTRVASGTQSPSPPLYPSPPLPCLVYPPSGDLVQLPAQVGVTLTEGYWRAQVEVFSSPQEPVACVEFVKYGSSVQANVYKIQCSAVSGLFSPLVFERPKKYTSSENWMNVIVTVKGNEFILSWDALSPDKFIIDLERKPKYIEIRDFNHVFNCSSECKFSLCFGNKEFPLQNDTTFFFLPKKMSYGSVICDPPIVWRLWTPEDLIAGVNQLHFTYSQIQYQFQLNDRPIVFLFNQTHKVRAASQCNLKIESHDVVYYSTCDFTHQVSHTSPSSHTTTPDEEVPTQLKITSMNLILIVDLILVLVCIAAIITIVVLYKKYLHASYQPYELY